MKTSREVQALAVDPVAQERIINDALRGFVNVLDSRIDFFPIEVQTMLKYIHEHLFEETLTVEKVKESCRLRNNNITTKFWQNVGTGTREYIVSQRLKAAASILHATEVSMYQVAFAVGFTEEAFSKLFKKKYGCTPLNYRSAKKNGQEILTRENNKGNGQTEMKELGYISVRHRSILQIKHCDICAVCLYSRSVKFGGIFSVLILLFVSGFIACEDSGLPLEPDLTIVFSESIARVRIGDKRADVVEKLGQPNRIVDGDFEGVIYYYTEGKQAFTFVGISDDPGLGLGVIGMSIEVPYQGRSKDSIGIGSERNFVISKLGVPDTTVGEPPAHDTYFYEKNTFEIAYENQHVLRISMDKPKRF